MCAIHWHAKSCLYELTWPVYTNGTIGAAKKDVERAATAISANHACQAYVAVNKAVVTQASSAIPVVPLYISILFKIMKAKGTHEDCIEQMVRLLNERLYRTDGATPELDAAGRIRVDDWEMDPEVQAEVAALWPEINTANLRENSDFDGYQANFLNLFGFGLPGVDYDAETEVELPLPSSVL